MQNTFWRKVVALGQVSMNRVLVPSESETYPSPLIQTIMLEKKEYTICGPVNSRQNVPNTEIQCSYKVCIHAQYQVLSDAV